MMPLLRCLKDDNATWFWMTVNLCNEDSSLWPEKDKKKLSIWCISCKILWANFYYINWNLGLGGRQGYNPASDML